MTAFHIGSQNGAVVNNVGGDQTVHGGQNVFVAVPAEIVRAAGDLIGALARADLEPQAQATVMGEARALRTELAASRAHGGAVAGRLTRIVAVLQRIGAGVVSIAGLAAPLTAIAHWLGPLGATVLAML